MLQIRLRDNECDELVAYAQDRNLPVSTVARALLLQSPAPQEDLKGALDRLEQDLSAVRRKALSAYQNGSQRRRVLISVLIVEVRGGPSTSSFDDFPYG